MNEEIEKYFQEQLSSEETLLLMRQIESDKILKKQFIKYQNFHALLTLAPHKGDQESARKKHFQFIDNQKKRIKRRLILKVIGYAASIVILIGGTWFTSQYQQNRLLTKTTNKLYAPAGQRACITLNDGTKIWLNSKSTLIYPAHFTAKERRVTIIGEAYFDVVKNPKKPFIVNAKSLNIKVLGTKFNVYAYPEAEFVQTSLVSGCLKVYPSHEESKGVVLHSNQEAIYKNGTIKVGNIQPDENFTWRDGVYYFNKEPFIDIIKKLELYYDVSIIVENPEILNIEYRGKFRQCDGIMDILHIIQKIHRFKIEKNDNVIILR